MILCVTGPLCNGDTTVDLPVVLSASNTETIEMSKVTSWCGNIENGLLDSSSAWCPLVYAPRNYPGSGRARYQDPYISSNKGEWLQLDAGSVLMIGQITTQGRHDADEWVEEYSISTSEDGVKWVEYHKDGALVSFKGNIERDIKVTHTLDPPPTARHVRFYPKQWRNAMAMRAGVAGCPSGDRFHMQHMNIAADDWFCRCGAPNARDSYAESRWINNTAVADVLCNAQV